MKDIQGKYLSKGKHGKAAVIAATAAGSCIDAFSIKLKDN